MGGFTHNFIWLVGSAVQQGRFGCFQAGIAEGDRDVTAEALIFCPQDRGVGITGFEFSFSEQKRFEQVRMRIEELGVIKKWSWVLGFVVGRADGLASVAAEDALPDQGAKGKRDGSAMLDGEVREAAPGVNTAVGKDGFGGASHLAAVAIGAIGIGEGFVWFEGQVDQQLAQEQPGSVVL